MQPLAGDLILLAAVAQAYGECDQAQDLYLLAQLGANLYTPLHAADMVCGLGLLGLVGAHVVGDHRAIPSLIGNALDQGHVVLAQYRDRTPKHAPHWCCLCETEGNDWRGVSAQGDYSSSSESSVLGSLLTGHYIIVASQLPNWDVPAPIRDPPMN